MAFARFFHYESEQDRICKHINGIAKKTMEEKIDMNDFPHEFGKQFIIGPELHNTSQDENRYYYLHFIDNIPNSLMPKRGKKKGILEVNKNGQLTILDCDDFMPLLAESRFVFEEGKLELHTHGRLDRISQSRNNDAVITGCIAAVALATVAGLAAYKMR